MIILINGVNLKVGGGVTVIFNFLNSIIENERFHNHSYHVIVPSNVGFEKYDKFPVKIELMPEKMKSPIKRLYLDYTWLKNRIVEINPNVIFSMGNIAIPSKIKQGVLFMYPYAIYPEDKTVWKILNITTQISYRLRNIVFKQRG